MSIEAHPLNATVAGSTAPSVQPRPRLELAVTRSFEWRQLLGGFCIAFGAIAIVLAWWGISGETDSAKQLPFLASGGVGGAALVAVGVTALVSYEHARDRQTFLGVLQDVEALREELQSFASRLGLQPATTTEQADASSPRRRSDRRTTSQS